MILIFDAEPVALKHLTSVECALPEPARRAKFVSEESTETIILSSWNAHIKLVSVSGIKGSSHLGPQRLKQFANVGPLKRKAIT